jgi:lipoprotein LpqH
MSAFGGRRQQIAGLESTKMRIRIAEVVVVPLLIGGLAGCTSAAPPTQQLPGAESAGTATARIDGQDAEVTHQVSCVPVDTLTKIVIGTEQAGATALVSNDPTLTVKSVNLRDLTGFTGTFDQGLGDEAVVTMVGRTYRMSGTAYGFDSADASHAKSSTFAIAVAC